MSGIVHTCPECGAPSSMVTHLNGEPGFKYAPPTVPRERWEKLRRDIDRIVHGDGSPSLHTTDIMENIHFTLGIEVEK